MIENTYNIHPETIAIIPAYNMDYDSIVMETNATYYVHRTPLEIVQEACWHDWTTYDGRRKAVARRMGFQQKTPIPINWQKDIYFFPTHSPKHMDNHWISLKHVVHFEKNTHKNSISIFLTNNQTIEVNMSLHTLEKQIQRTRACEFESNALDL